VTARNLAILFGIVFVIVGVLGYVPNPIVGPDGIFVTNSLHNIVHLVSGIVLLLGAFTAFGSGNALKLIGVVYGLVAVLGFVMSGDEMFGIAMNMNDRWLHVVLAAAILAAGFLLPGERA